jgi:hypothetical protein
MKLIAPILCGLLILMACLSLPHSSTAQAPTRQTKDNNNCKSSDKKDKNCTELSRSEMLRIEAIRAQKERLERGDSHLNLLGNALDQMGP